MANDKSSLPPPLRQHIIIIIIIAKSDKPLHPSLPLHSPPPPPPPPPVIGGRLAESAHDWWRQGEGTGVYPSAQSITLIWEHCKRRGNFAVLPGCLYTPASLPSFLSQARIALLPPRPVVLVSAVVVVVAAAEVVVVEVGSSNNSKM